MQIKKERRMNHQAAPKENEKEFLFYIISHSKQKRYRAVERRKETGGRDKPFLS